MYSTTGFKRKVFVLSIKVLLPYNNKWVSASSLIDRRLGLTILTFCRRDSLSFFKSRTGAFSWLTTLPIKEEGYILNK